MNKRIETISEQIGDEPEMEDLNEKGNSLKEKISEWQSKVIELRQKGFQDALNWPAGMNAEFFLLRSNLDTYDPKVANGYQKRFNDLESMWDEHKVKYDQLMGEDVPGYNELYRSKNLPALKISDPEKKAG
jgi:formiminotetrahydrofolate cyclodeaminase